MIGDLFFIEEPFADSSITVRVIGSGNDLVLILGGGSPHVGSVNLSFFGQCGSNDDSELISSELSIPGHKDQIIGRKFSTIISEKFGVACVVVCGIHFDNASAALIQKIISVSDLLLEKCIAQLETIFNDGGF